METSPKPVTVTIDSHQISVPEDTTILEAARQHGIRIPTLCHHPALSAWGGCRMCVVEVDGNPRLTASCVMPVREGMNIVTTNDGIIAARRLILEFLFAERNHNCMFCSQSGDCELQALAYELQMDHLTVPQSFEAFPVDITSEYMAFDHNRCILCGRCVRACREIAGAYVLNYQKRGIQNQIAFDLDVSRSESSCLECGVCMQLCPTGAIFSRYRTHRSVLGHPKSARQVTDSFCTGCGLMCDTQLVIEENQVIRVDGCLHSDHDGPILGQLCARGRFEILKTPGHRLLTPMIRESDGTWNPSSWKMAMDRIEKNMNGFNTGIFGLVSSRCANEQIMIFRDMMLKGWKADYLNVLEGPSLRSIADAWTELGKTFLALKESHAGRILDADHVLVVGVSAFNTQPAIGGIIRRIILEKGVPATVIGSVDAISPRTRHYIPVTPGKEPVLVQAFLAQVLKSQHQPGTPAWESVLSEFESIDIQKSLSLVGLDTSDQEIFQSAVNTFVHSQSPIIIAGRGVTGQFGVNCLRHLMLLSLTKGILPENALRMIILKPDGNSTGSLKLGIPAGNTIYRPGAWQRGVMLLEDENLSNSLVLNRLNALDFLAVITPYFPEALADKAHVLIPRPVGLEEEGTYTSLNGQENRVRQAVLDRPDQVGESWQTLLALIQRTEFHPGYARWKDIHTSVMREIRAG